MSRRADGKKRGEAAKGLAQPAVSPELCNAVAQVMPGLEQAFTSLEVKLGALGVLDHINRERWFTLPHIQVGDATYVMQRFPFPPPKRLGPREAAIRELIRQGASKKEIAHKLGMSLRTLETHLDRLRLKYRASSRSELCVRIQQMH